MERGRGGDEEGVKGVTEAMGGRGGGCDRGDGGGGEEMRVLVRAVIDNFNSLRYVRNAIPYSFILVELH